MRVVGDDGEQLGVLPTREALRLAQEKSLDLVEIAARAVPPVCRIMDYGKFKYEESKKKKQAKKSAANVEVKEIKFRPKTDRHDFDFKVRHIRRFLMDGNKVRLVVAFRGREIVHPSMGKNVLDDVTAACADIGHVEHIPLMEGRRMLMILSPRVNVIKKLLAEAKAGIAQKDRPALAPVDDGLPLAPLTDQEDDDDDDGMADAVAAAVAAGEAASKAGGGTSNGSGGAPPGTGTPAGG